MRFSITRIGNCYRSGVSAPNWNSADSAGFKSGIGGICFSLRHSLSSCFPVFLPLRVCSLRPPPSRPFVTC